MAVTSSGEIKLSDLQTEFGGSSPIAFSEYHFNASGPNTNGFFPDSGEINLASFYGAIPTATVALSSSTTDVSLATKFGVAWAKNCPKILNIDSGVTIGATTGNPAVAVSSGMGGTLEIVVGGTVTGTGGSAGAGGGGDNLNNYVNRHVNTFLWKDSYQGQNGSNGGDGGHAIFIQSKNV